MARKQRPVPLRIALAQMNTTVGDIEGNARRAGEWIDSARAEGARLVVLPEMTINGYPPEDLLLKRHFLVAGREALRGLAAEIEGIVALVGFAQSNGFANNALAVLAEGEIQGTYSKMLLPNYGVFDERRYFEPGSSPALIELDGALIGLTVCEDIWFPGPPSSAEAMAGASLIVNASASPYHRGKGIEREEMVAERARETGAAFALCNAVGGQDELVFDGHSVIVSASGETLARGRQFAEELLVCDLELPGPETAGRRGADRVPAGLEAPVLARVEFGPRESERGECPIADPLEAVAEVYEALKLGLHDYVEKNGFERVVLALSGGIDSALVALVAVDALGPGRVTCVVMPSPHSSEATQADARTIATNLGVELIEIPIETAMTTYAELLTDNPVGEADRSDGDLAAENLQARIRGNLVMALSNRHGWLVLTTGNKSEMSVGYATLYGDMAGGFAVIKDVPKTLVYELVRHRNARSRAASWCRHRCSSAPPPPSCAPISSTRTRCRPTRCSTASSRLTSSATRGRDEIAEDGIPADVVEDVLRMVDRAEYKRRQAPPGIKITPKAFGRDRRLPITNRFRG